MCFLSKAKRNNTQKIKQNISQKMMPLSTSISLANYINVVPPLCHPKLVFSLSRGKYGFTNNKPRIPNISPSKVLESVKYVNVRSAITAAKASGFGANGTTSDYDQEKKFTMQPELMPQHVAMILDDHRVWGAGQEGLSLEDRLKASRAKIVEMARFFQKIGVKVFTVFAPSVHDLLHPGGQDEVGQLKSLFDEDFTETALDKIMEYQIRINILGDHSQVSKSVRKKFAIGETMTMDNTGPHILIALNYGGRQDIIQAAQKIATKVKDGEMSLDDINEASFEKELQTNCTEFPCPDLLIRTGDCKRISNFMLWQTAYTEFHFVEKLFPELEEEDFLEALNSYQKRKRRFGAN